MNAPRVGSRSYQGQDLFVIEMLGGMRDGFFIDSGASDGVSGSNSLLLEAHYGWRGICVEPNDAMFAKLSRARRAVCVNYCLYHSAGDVAFFEAAGVLGGIVDEYDPGLLRYATTLVADQVGDAAPVTKQARTIGSILQEHDAPQVIDYWSLDTEGSELAILNSFPFDKYTVRVLTVEHNFTPARDHIRALLESKGYLRARDMGIDDGYVRQDMIRSTAWRSRVWSRPRRLA